MREWYALTTSQSIPVVDLFAGPGGLGEGFAGGPPGDRGQFDLILSAESDPAAHRTLRLRAFKHLLESVGESASGAYRDVAEGKSPHGLDRLSEALWTQAGQRAQRLTLGESADDECLDQTLREAGIGPETPWVLVGGPPCQAYSLVGRARNQGNATYRPEKDKRHRLYEEYLRVIRAFSPPVFVMENVKGLLSSTVAGQRIFETILTDLARPNGCDGVQYAIHALSSNAVFEAGMDPADLDARSFVVEAENHGIPQSRHRVFLVGVRQDIEIHRPLLLPFDEPRTVAEALGGMPRLRSRLSREPDSESQWNEAMADNVAFLRSIAANLPKPIRQLIRSYRATGLEFPAGEDSLRRLRECTDWPETGTSSGDRLMRWIRQRPPRFLENHEPRAHMRSDLNRYLFCGLYAAAYGRSPSAAEFPPDLAPSHANWTTGKFADRFRVQVPRRPSSTVTSHIAKDGHYYIHPDVSQCRSLSVREAARLQTFPDNYVFLGNRTEQYVQVGNAVPPYLARQIAKVIGTLFDSGTAKESATTPKREQSRARAESNLVK